MANGIDDMKRVISQAPTNFPAVPLKEVMPPPSGVSQQAMMNGAYPTQAPQSPGYGFGMGADALIAEARSKKYAAAARPLYALAGQMVGGNVDQDKNQVGRDQLALERDKAFSPFPEESTPIAPFSWEEEEDPVASIFKNYKKKPAQFSAAGLGLGG